MANTQISKNDVPSVQISNDQIVTTSTDIAKCFGKRHDNLLRKIENLECSADFHALNFEEMIIDVEIGKGATRQDRAYHITKDGFVYLAMGFTGAKAAQFKEAYINAFNQMEKQLHEQKHLPATSNHETNFQNKEKYQILNNMITAMKLEGNPVVVPASDLNGMVQAIRTFLTKKATANRPTTHTRLGKRQRRPHQGLRQPHLPRRLANAQA